MSIRIDCYLVKMMEFKKANPKALFYVITHRSGSLLSPSIKLLLDAGIMPLPLTIEEKKRKKKGEKIKRRYKPKISFNEYKERFIKEIKNNKGALIILKNIKNLYDLGNTIFLVCYEKDHTHCHRSIIKELIEDYHE